MIDDPVFVVGLLVLAALAVLGVVLGLGGRSPKISTPDSEDSVSFTVTGDTKTGRVEIREN